MSVGIKRSGVLEILSVALVVDAQPIGWKGKASKSMGRVGCRRERFSLRRTGHWGRSGAGRVPVSEEVKGGVGLDSGCGRVVPRKNKPYDIFVDLNAERDAHGVRNSWTTES